MYSVRSVPVTGTTADPTRHLIPRTMTHDTMWYDTSAKDKHLVRRMARAVVKGEPFVISIGGMSDTAGHGNLASESYPAVMFEALKVKGCEGCEPRAGAAEDPSSAPRKAPVSTSLVLFAASLVLPTSGPFPGSWSRVGGAQPRHGWCAVLSEYALHG